MARFRGWLPVVTGLFAIVLLAGCGSAATPSPTPSATLSAPPTAEPSPSASVEVSASPSPAAATKVYIVRKGDTLYAIAKANGITLAVLRAVNPSITDPTKLRIGQKLLIPER